MPPPHSTQHPGEALRKIIAKNGLNISKAAALLGVTRPPLSNLLNGKAGLSLEMAQRFAIAFPADTQEILALQSAYEHAQSSEQAKERMVRTYMPSFLAITARQIEAWADGNIAARAQLPALLRRLVNGSGIPLSKVDFPAFDNAQRHGWDGQVEADAASPWLARGSSGWEFGCDRDPATKAETEYKNRKGSLMPDLRAAITFVFVTPRNWPGKEGWAKAKRDEGAWKDVRALDASDLEQWLEQCPAAQAWFAELIGSSQLQGLKSVEAAWTGWANATTIPLPKLLFRRAVETKGSKLKEWLKRTPSEPLIVAADSDDEAIAFIACALEELGPAGRDFDGALVVETAAALHRVAALGANLILISASSEVEAAYAALHRPPHLIIARRRNSLPCEPDITLDLVDDESFRAALEVMGLHQPDFQRYTTETANSPTILRRRFAKLPSLKTPVWSTDEATARALIPLVFAGVWDSDNADDLEIMRCLTGQERDEIEQVIVRLGTIEDAPTWLIGKYRGVTSKIDALFAIQHFLTGDDLQRFLFVAEIVLAEEDPAQDLPRDQQWAAGIYGKTRAHSSALRRGLCETLVLLAAHGDQLFGRRLNMNVQARVNRLVRDLLTPLDGRTWTSQRHDLPRYAEAAPDTFLDILEQDLASPEPKVLALMQSADNTLFGDCPRSGLLWALERLAWNPGYLLRVARLLAKLAEIHISDNWANTPKASLDAVFRSWMPQTAASIEARNAVMAALCRDYPRTGWRLIVEQIGTHHAIGHYSARPEWRNDASGAGEPVKTNQEIILVAEEAMRLAMAWPQHDQRTFGDLVEHMDFIPPDEQEKIWVMIIHWAQSDISDDARHQLRERIREVALTRRAQIRGSVTANINKAREAYRQLAPRDLVMRHLWLFEKSWIGEVPDDEEDDEYDFHKHEARVSAAQRAALSEILAQEGFAGILRLSILGDADWAIGINLPQVLPESEWAEILDRLVGQGEPPAERKVDLIIAGFLVRLPLDQRHCLIAEMMKRYRPTGEIEEAIRLLKVSPFRMETWSHLVALPTAWQQRYWQDAQVQWQDHTPSEMNILVERLVAVGRPRAAFHVLHMDFDMAETKLLAELLRAVATSDSEPDGHYRLDQYYIAQAFKSLNRRGLDEAELIQLEFLYAEALDHSEYGIPTLEKALEKEPQLFVQLVAAIYRRKDGGQDPTEWRIDDNEHRSRMGTMAFKILSRFTRLPGTDSPEPVAVLRRWVDIVRSLGADVGRAAMTDHAIGEMFGRSAVGADGVWPCHPVREVFEAIASRDMAAGMRIGRYNSRGVHARGPGGGQERVLAEQYRGWADAVAYQYPFTAKLMNEMAQQYDHEAGYHDTEDDVRKRIGY
jgi:plasmid maintenance system antidote protein VapI